MFIVLEGIDGCGKSTQATRLAATFAATGREVLHLREPGATPLGERLRSIVLARNELSISPRAEALLYSTARAELVDSVIRPALARGCVVVCERYFYSTLAYQGSGLGLDRQGLEAVSTFATGGLLPDRVFVLDLPVDVALARLARGHDRIEARGRDYLDVVRRAFLEMALLDRPRFWVVDASADPDRVASEVARHATHDVS
jgi:dTMP kinase